MEKVTNHWWKCYEFVVIKWLYKKKEKKQEKKFKITCLANEAQDKRGKTLINCYFNADE